MHNQTNPEWLQGMVPDALGTGLFVDHEHRKYLVPDLTYDQTVERGHAYIVFRWIPHAVMSYDELIESA